MRTTSQRTVLFAVLFSMLCLAARAQGVQPLTEDALAMANGLVSRGAKSTDILFLNDPISVRQVVLNRPDYRPGPEDQDLIGARREWPFRFTVVSPFVRAAFAIAEAARRFQNMPDLNIQELNAALVVVHVEPGSAIIKDAIGDVIIQRGAHIIAKENSTATSLITFEGLSCLIVATASRSRTGGAQSRI